MRSGDRLRVVLLITNMDQGGAQEAILRLARHLRARGHDAETWFLYERSPFYRGEEGVRVILPEAAPSAAGYLRIAGRLVRQLRAHGPDAVISFLPLANGLGQIEARLAGIRFRVASQRNPSWTYSPWMRRLDKVAGTLGFYTANAANSMAVRDSFKGYPGGYRKHLTVIHNGLEWDVSGTGREAARTSFGLPWARALILNVGRLCEQKNQSLLLRVLPELNGAYLVLAGDGEDRDKLEHMALDLGIEDRVFFLGKVSRDRIPDLLRACDIFAMPSLYEGQSNALLEAMQAGLPIVSSDIPAQAEVLGGPGPDAAGEMLALDDAAWKEALSALVSDPRRRRSFAERALRRSGMFSMDAMTDRFEKLIMPAQDAGTDPGGILAGR